VSEKIENAAKAPEGPSESSEPGCEPDIIENLRALATKGNVLRQDSIDDYGAAVLAEQIEILRSMTSALDRQYAKNIRGRKITFKNQVAYLVVREKVTSKIVDFVGNLREIRSTYPTSESEPVGGNRSWNPDADPGSESP
jgi:hypothetical protein